MEQKEQFNRGVLTIPNTDSLGKLESAEAGVSLTAAYRRKEDWPLFKDKPINCYYLGMKEIPNSEGETVLCAVFIDPSGVFLAAQTVLVEAVKNQVEGQGIQIVFKGEKKNISSQGNTLLFEVRKLNLKIEV